MLISATCSEITIKGGNRRLFENLLMRNIRSALDGLGTASLVRQPGRILISSESMDSGQAAHALSRVFGIDHISVCAETEP
ncbi:MAG: hypothetical protein U0R44_07205, partial [Candidatus Micrarchaeia archaeon]